MSRESLKAIGDNIEKVIVGKREVIDLIHALEDIDAALGGDGASRLPEAVERLSRKGSADGRKRRR